MGCGLSFPGHCAIVEFTGDRGMLRCECGWSKGLWSYPHRWYGIEAQHRFDIHVAEAGPHGGHLPVTDLHGDEDRVLFAVGQCFAGPVTADWLLSRLRLGPAGSPFDDLVSGVWVDLNGEEVFSEQGIEPLLAERGTPTHYLASFNAGAEIYGSARLMGPWFEDSLPEVRDLFTWAGDAPDCTKLALDWAVSLIVEFLDYGLEGHAVRFSSAYLRPDEDDHAKTLAQVAGHRFADLWLNETLLYRNTILPVC